MTTTVQTTWTHLSRYKPPYYGSIVPLGFKCNCGGGVITTWAFFYSYNFQPWIGEHVGQCTKCHRIYPRGSMSKEA